MIPVSGGVATGVVCIVRDPSEAPDLPDNCILVCPSTDPGWMPLLVNVAGLIVERGGVLSHGALIARDLGIPAVVCKGVTASMKDGQHVKIDGFRGVIEVVSDGGVN